MQISSKKLSCSLRWILSPYMLVILLLVLMDQWSKSFMIEHLKQQTGYMMQALPFLNMVYSWNHGISFGFMGEYYQYSNYAFLIINSIIICYLFYLLASENSSMGKWAISCIIGGALGNIIDRITRGAVFDFIYFNYGEWFFPAFNLADSFITLGAIIFAIKLFKHQPKNSLT